jgi:hypothetical protein
MLRYTLTSVVIWHCIEIQRLLLPVFPSFQDVVGVKHTLTFQRQITRAALLFTTINDKSQGFCVKIIYGPYGENEHQMLADEEMAPLLFGASRIENGPAVVVMRMLDESWQTLRDFAHKNSRRAVDGVQLVIRKRLEKIATKLKEKGLVHGDFRLNNIMVQPAKEALAGLVGFDWAGKRCEVHYPLYRNEDGMQWPGEEGLTIRLGYDRATDAEDRTQWQKLLSKSAVIVIVFVIRLLPVIAY